MRLVGLVLVALIAVDAVIALVLLLLVDKLAAAVTGVSMLATFALLWFILPRRYEVWPDRLRLQFPTWGWDILYEGIATVRAGRWYEAYGFAGVRFATAPSQLVTILRHRSNMLRRPNLVITPRDRDEFLRQLHRAMGRTEHTGD
jgi:hypothetical protein